MEPLDLTAVHADRKCPQCGNDEMTYTTQQTRSADEGQTVFYTCPKCKFKETENS
uniref:DNA-directed RNA polymerase I subunit RPA12 n=1 Tax=Amphimedon queenslandica TaxID=400682 RepID=A0A1X7VAQ9_AMPQE